MTRVSLALILILLAVTGSSSQNFPEQLIRRASADEQVRLPDWVSDGMVAALTRDSGEAVWLEALRFPVAPSLLGRIPGRRRNEIITALLTRLQNCTAGRVDPETLAPRRMSSVEDDRPAGVRGAAAQLLGAVAKHNRERSDEIITALLACLDDGDAYVRSVAAQALGSATKENKERSSGVITQLLSHLFADDETYVRISVAQALGEVGKDNKEQTDQLITKLLVALREGQVDAGVRLAAAQTLGVVAKGNRERSNEVITVLLARLTGLLGDGDASVRLAAAQTLGALAEGNKERSNEVIKVLLARLGEGDTGVRVAAAQALGAVAKDNKERSDEVIVRLRTRLLEEGDAGVRLIVAQAIGTMVVDKKERSDAIIAALLRHLGDGEAYVRLAAVQALGVVAKDNKESSNAVITALLDRLRDGETYVLAAAAQALGVVARDNKERSGEIITTLLERLSDGTTDVRAATAQALGRVARDQEERSDEVIVALLAHLDDRAYTVRYAAVQALGAVARDNKERNGEVVNKLLALLNDGAADVRVAATQSLDSVMKINKEQRDVAAAALLARLGDGDVRVRTAAVRALIQMPTPLSAVGTVPLLGLAADRPLEAARMEATFHILSGGNDQPALLLPVLRRLQREAARYSEPEATLALFVTIWPVASQYAELRRQIAWHAKNLAERMCAGRGAVSKASLPPLPAGVAELWTLAGTFLFRACFSADARKEIDTLSGLFVEASLPEGGDLKRVLKDDEARDRFTSALWWIIGIMAAHGGLWVVLLWLYPRQTWVQAVFFWNPWVRKLLGLHLSILIPLVPFARRRLLAPFRPALGPKAASAGAINVAQTAWFPDAEVTEGNGTERVPITRALPRIRGLTILEGASGLGKTVHLVRLAYDQKHVVAFIQAGEEGGDVVKALAARLPADVMRDEAFLRTLIHAGGLDICIDGLNEVSAEARAAVASFAQAATKANVLISTQPIRWTRPAGARQLHLQPLRPDQQTHFLESREAVLPTGAILRGDRFKERVRDFVREINTTAPTDVEERVARDRALSNPMDLTTIALILANGGVPDLLNLQQTAYLQAAIQYSESNQGAEFPMTTFSEYIYEERCKATGQERELIMLRNPRFAHECDALSDHRLLLKSYEINEDGKELPTWRFRHDKVLDFFLFVAITNQKVMQERWEAHIGDTRFRGVYLLLALQAPLDVAKDIRDRLTDHASDTRDHSLSDEFWKVVRQRLDQYPSTKAAQQAAETV